VTPLAKKKRPPPDDKLAKPIKIALAHPTIAGGALDPAVQEAASKINEAERQRGFAEAMNRLELLFPYYKLDRTGNDAVDFRLLALALASELFKGFRVKDVNESKPYQHKRGNPLTLLLLLADVEAIKQERSCNDREAVDELKRDERFKNDWRGIEPRILRNWLSEAHDPDKNEYWPYWQSNEVTRLVLTLLVNHVVRGPIPARACH
jgi:hypothetical protein